MKTKTLWMVLAALTIVASFASDAAAIPAFARKYGFSCTTCHAPAPRLKDYGNEFAASGFELPDGEEPVRAYRDTGDPLLRLQRDLPFAVRLDAFATWTDRDQGDDGADLKTPWGLKLLSGGTVMPGVGYYFYFYMAEAGDVAGVEDAYLHFDDLGGIPLDLMVGQFQLCDPMMKRELRLSFEDYQVYRVRPGFASANLTYERGVMVTYDTPFGLSLLGQLVNGNGLSTEGENGDLDTNQDKGVAGRAAYAVGPVTLGGYYYRTTENGEDDTAMAFENDVEIFGPDVHLQWDRVGVSAQYLRRQDSDPGLGVGEVDTDGIVVEVTLLPWGPDGKDTFTALFNQIDSDDDAVDYQSVTASWSHLHARNLRMVAEVTHDLENEDTRFVVGFVTAF